MRIAHRALDLDTGTWKWPALGEKIPPIIPHPGGENVAQIKLASRDLRLGRGKKNLEGYCPPEGDGIGPQVGSFGIVTSRTPVRSSPL